MMKAVETASGYVRAYDTCLKAGVNQQARQINGKTALRAVEARDTPAITSIRALAQFAATTDSFEILNR
jgi:hypothetical protein